MPFGWKINDESWQQAGCFEHKHLPWAHCFALAGSGIGFEVIRKGLFELQRDATTHHTNTIHRVDQGLRFRAQDVTCGVANHHSLPTQKYHSRRTSSAGL